MYIAGARPIEGRGVLSIFLQFFVFWCSFMSTSTQTSCYVMVILVWGWVGWGGAITFMSTCTHTHTSCYVMVIFSCTCTHTSCYVMVILGWGWVGWGGAMYVNLHTHVMLRYGYLLLHLHTHVMLRYGYLGVGLGGVGCGNNVHVNLHTHVMLRYGDLLLHLHTHVMLRYGDLLLHLHAHVMLRYGDLLLHLKGLKDYIPKSFPRRLYHGVNTKEDPELEKFVLGYCWRNSLGPLTPHRFLDELCKAVKAIKSFWEEGNKVLHPKKTRTYVKKRSSFGDVQNPIFHVNMIKKWRFSVAKNVC